MSRTRCVIAGIASLGLLSFLPGQQGTTDSKPSDAESGEMRVHRASEVRWRKGPDSLPQGAEIALLEGDPSKPGPFVFRVKAPDGYTIPPHTHPKAERVTVISGVFHLGMGEKIDKTAGQAMSAGSFGYWPAGMKHFAWVTGETILQLHGSGPWQINYLNPADDPRGAGKK